MTTDQKIIFVFLDAALRLEGLRLETLRPLVTDSFRLWSMFQSAQAEFPDQPVQRLGFYGDIHVNPGIARSYQSDAALVSFPFLMTIWRAKMMRELSCFDATFDGLTVPIHENCLFTHLSNVADNGNQNSYTSQPYKTAAGAHLKPVFHFVGYYFNMGQG